MSSYVCIELFFFFKDTATTEFYTYGHTRSRHDALPICIRTDAEMLLLDAELAPAGKLRLERIVAHVDMMAGSIVSAESLARDIPAQDRKSTRLNSSH